MRERTLEELRVDNEIANAVGDEVERNPDSELHFGLAMDGHDPQALGIFEHWKKNGRPTWKRFENFNIISEKNGNQA